MQRGHRESHTRHFYAVDEVLSALQKSIRRGLQPEAVFWAGELCASDLDIVCIARLQVVALEDIGIGSPLAPFVSAYCWNKYKESGALRYITGLADYLAKTEKSRSSSMIPAFARAKAEELLLEGGRLYTSDIDEVSAALKAVDDARIGSEPEFLQAEAEAVLTVYRYLLSAERNQNMDSLLQFFCAAAPLHVRPFVDGLYKLATTHGLLESALKYVFAQNFLLLTRYTWMDLPPLSDVAAIVNEFEEPYCGDMKGGPRTDTSNRHYAIPLWAIDIHTWRGAHGTDYWDLLCKDFPELNDWSAEEKTKSHGPIERPTRGAFFVAGCLTRYEKFPGPRLPAHTSSWFPDNLPPLALEGYLEVPLDPFFNVVRALSQYTGTVQEIQDMKRTLIDAQNASDSIVRIDARPSPIEEVHRIKIEAAPRRQRTPTQERKRRWKKT